MEIKAMNRVRVEINGNVYTLRGETPVADLLAISALVNEKISAIHRQYPGYNPTRAAVLACLQIAEEYHKLKQDYEEIVQAIAWRE